MRRNDMQERETEHASVIPWVDDAELLTRK
jgi:hypothetical protein